MTETVRVLGTTDDRDTCDCCGKTGLKRTVVLDFGGEYRYYGTTCAAYALLGRKLTRGSADKAVTELVHKHRDEIADRIYYARRAHPKYPARDRAMSSRDIPQVRALDLEMLLEITQRPGIAEYVQFAANRPTGYIFRDARVVSGG